MKKKIFRNTVMFALVSITSVTYTLSASAYELYGGRYTQDIYSKKYYNGSPTYISSTGMNHSLPFESSISDWNKTENTRVYWIKTTTKSESILDSNAEWLTVTGWLGYTRHYSGNTHITDTANNYWYWAEALTNINHDWKSFSSGAIYTNMNYKMQWATAHEIGHAMGLDHAGEDPFGLDQKNKLMYSSPRAYYENGVYKPTSDEVAGIQKIYGKLY